MGKSYSLYPDNAEYNTYMERFKPGWVPATNCLICWDSIEPREWTECHQCNIYLHSRCEKKYRGNRGYCKCPHCQQVGTLGSPRWE